MSSQTSLIANLFLYLISLSDFFGSAMFSKQCHRLLTFPFFTFKVLVLLQTRQVTNHVLSYMYAPHSTVLPLPLDCSGYSALLFSLAELPYLAALSHSCLPCLGSYLCSHEVVHQPVLLSPDWASAPGFLSSGVQVSSVSTSEPESPLSPSATGPVNV